MHVYGPVSCRRSDKHHLRVSAINRKLAILQQHELVQYRVYGDSAYTTPILSHVRARHSHYHLTPQEILENQVRNSCRQSIEWNYGHLSSLFKTLDFTNLLQIRKAPVAPMFISAMILRNAYVCFYGNQTTQYFDCQAPTFSDWTRAGPRMIQLPVI